MDVVEFVGVVEAVSKQHKGIKVNGRWFNCDGLKELPNKGSRVELKVEGKKKVVSLRVIDQESSQIDPNKIPEEIRKAVETLDYCIQAVGIRFPSWDEETKRVIACVVFKEIYGGEKE